MTFSDTNAKAIPNWTPIAILASERTQKMRPIDPTSLGLMVKIGAVSAEAIKVMRGFYHET